MMKTLHEVSRVSHPVWVLHFHIVSNANLQLGQSQCRDEQSAAFARNWTQECCEWLETIKTNLTSHTELILHTVFRSEFARALLVHHGFGLVCTVYNKSATIWLHLPLNQTIPGYWAHQRKLLFLNSITQIVAVCSILYQTGSKVTNAGTLLTP